MVFSWSLADTEGMRAAWYAIPAHMGRGYAEKVAEQVKGSKRKPLWKVKAPIDLHILFVLNDHDIMYYQSYDTENKIIH